MKILAIEHELRDVDWTTKDAILKEEASHVYEQYLMGILREIYFTENKTAVLILEADSKAEAQKILSLFPLVRENLIRFEVSELQPFDGFGRLINRNK